jgi:hypothetical protein
MKTESAAHAQGFAQALEALQRDPTRWAAMSRPIQARFDLAFTLPAIFVQYKTLLTRFLPAG